MSGDVQTQAERPSLLDTAAAQGDPAATVGDTTTGDGGYAPVEYEPGAKLGRYLVTERLGMGGMGVVYAAFDPELDRKVAIKLLLGEPGRLGSTPSARSGGAARLLREAQAMAKLHHPNVIVVHDVGTVDGQVFIAMEYLDGGTLHEYLQRRPRPWRDVVAMYRRAGAGLAAAHAAEIVHRDFKPQNVLLGRDDRVCVMDFGLARSGSSESLVTGPSHYGTDDPSEALSKLTQTGAIVGTPAYMAPEQHENGVVDARSDQFAFCVALYEGLYGQRPFAGDTMAALAYNVLHGVLRPPPSGRRVPRWLFPIIARGLSVAPDDRFSSMHDLLAALDPAVRRSRRLVGLGLGAVALLATGGVAWALVRGDDAVCTGSRQLLGELWNARVQQEIADAFAATSAPDAAKVWSSVSAELDDYAERWIAMHKDACEATRVRGEQSEELLDRRMVCLDKRRRELGKLVELFADADAELVPRAQRLVSRQPSLEPCADAEALLDGVAPPDPEIRDRVLAAQATIQQVRILRDAGRFETARQVLDEVQKEVDALDHAPTRVSLLYYQSAVAADEARFDDAERLAYDAAVLASEVGDDEAAALAWTGLIRIVGLQKRKFEELPPMIKAAEAALARIDNDFQRGSFLSTVGTVDILRERYAEAEPRLREAHELLTTALGPKDPRTLDTYEMLALSLHYQGRLDEAEPILREILAVYEAKEQPPPALGQTLGNLANLLDERGDPKGARTMHQRALEALTATYGPEHPAVAAAHDQLASLARRAGDFDASAAHVDASLAILIKTVGPKASPVAYAHHGRGQLELARKNPDAARQSFAEALEIWEASLGPDHARIAAPLTGMAKAELMAERAEAAVPLLERALRLRESDSDVDPDDLADTRFQLARALWDGAGDRKRARALAQQAREGLATAKEQSAVAEVDVWLSEHGRK